MNGAPSPSEAGKDRSFSTLDAPAFARLFGTTTENILQVCGSLLGTFDFRYEILLKEEQNQVVQSVLQKIESGDLIPSGKDRKGDWERGWQENLDAFVAGNFDLSALAPKYISKYPVSRLFQQYVRPVEKKFELNFYTVFRHYLFNTYFSPYKTIFEFGCGSGYNLVIMNRLYPDKKIVGLDWATSSVNIANTLGQHLHTNISGTAFDYFQPNENLEVPPDSLFITLNSLEQLGAGHTEFLNFILKKKPALCINSEPFLEMYDSQNFIDSLAIRYHTARNYLAGYYTALEQLESEGRIRILKRQRIPLGNLFHEGYSFIVWSVV